MNDKDVESTAALLRAAAWSAHLHQHILAAGDAP